MKSSPRQVPEQLSLPLTSPPRDRLDGPQRQEIILLLAQLLASALKAPAGSDPSEVDDERR